MAREFYLIVGEKKFNVDFFFSLAFDNGRLELYANAKNDSKNFDDCIELEFSEGYRVEQYFGSWINICDMNLMNMEFQVDIKLPYSSWEGVEESNIHISHYRGTTFRIDWYGTVLGDEKFNLSALWDFECFICGSDKGAFDLVFNKHFDKRFFIEQEEVVNQKVVSLKEIEDEKDLIMKEMLQKVYDYQQGKVFEPRTIYKYYPMLMNG